MKFILFTDPHIVPPSQTLFSENPLARLQACIADINAQHSDADMCIVTGDLAHHGERDAYLAFQSAISDLRIPVHLLLGNHDDRAIFREIFPDASIDADGFVQCVIETPAGYFVLIDTHEPGTHRGFYCERRRAWLKAQLEATRDRPVYLFMHHSPVPMHHPALDQFDLVHAREMADLLQDFNHVRHIFFGHVHRPVSGSWRGIPVSAMRALNHQVWLDFRRDDLICSLEPPAYAVAFLQPDSVVVHTHDFLDASRKYRYQPDAARDQQFVPL